MRLVLVLLVVTLAFTFSTATFLEAAAESTSTSCGHGQKSIQEMQKRELEQSSKEQENRGKRRLSNYDFETSYKPIRIKVSYTDVDRNSCNYTSHYARSFEYGGSIFCSSSKDVMTTYRRSRLKLAMSRAIDKLQRSLRVRRFKASRVNVTVPNLQSCGYHTVPTEFLFANGGVADVDFLLLVSSSPSTSEGVIAWASACVDTSYLDPNQGYRSVVRPVVGKINFAMMHRLEWDIESVQQTLEHELLHALSFSPYYWGRLLERNVHGRWTLKGANAVAVARAHFGCDKINVIPLEDDGAGGSANSHLEAALFRSSLMSAAISLSGGKLDAVTLAIMQDQGAYQVNYSESEFRFGGRKRGCSYWDKEGESCSATPSGEAVCTTERSGYGICAQDRSFSLRNYIAAYSNRICHFAESMSSISSTGNTFHKNSRCFNTVHSSTGGLNQIGSGISTTTSPRCLEMKCSSSSSSSPIQIRALNGSFVPCPVGSSVALASYNGLVTCPKTESEKSFYCSSIDDSGNGDAAIVPAEVLSGTATRSPTPAPASRAFSYFSNSASLLMVGIIIAVVNFF